MIVCLFKKLAVIEVYKSISSNWAPQLKAHVDYSAAPHYYTLEIDWGEWFEWKTNAKW